jgi:hypothetical protein
MARYKIDPSDPNVIIDTETGERHAKPQNPRKNAGRVISELDGTQAEAAGNYQSPGLLDTATILSQLTPFGAPAALGRGIGSALGPVYRGLQGIANNFPRVARPLAKGVEGGLRGLTGSTAGVNKATTQWMPKSFVPPVGGGQVLPALYNPIKTPRAYTPMQRSVADAARKAALLTGGGATRPDAEPTDAYMGELRFGDEFGTNYGPEQFPGAGGILDGITPDMYRGTPGAGGVLDGITPDMYRGAGASRAGATGAGATGADAPLPPPRPSEEEIKKLIAMQAYANNYQSNSLPVLNEGKINWGTDAAGYDGGDSYGGNAADFFRADALRMAVPGLLGM